MGDPRKPRPASLARRALLPVAQGVVERLRLERAAARHVVPRLRLIDPSAEAFRRSEGAVERKLTCIAASEGPVLVGPWLSEVGFEVLYWIPFLQRLAQRYELDPARLTAVSRGGVGSWYDGICASYLDVFELVDERSFRESLHRSWEERGRQKQVDVRGFDAELARSAAERLGLGEPELLHPSLMYRLFSEYWLHRIAFPAVLEHLAFRPFSPPPPLELPQEFVAARFYFRETFPDTPENRELVASILERLAAHSPVVLLDTGLELDDHPAAPVLEHPDVRRPLVGVPAAENLHVQSAVLARARAFVGTYGGLAYLANAYGVPALALLSPPAAKLGISHAAVARRLSAATGGSLSVVSSTALDALAGISSPAIEAS